MAGSNDGARAEALERRIGELRAELARAEGTPTEVYSRIVGYYRSVRNWNAGKRDEYSQRLAYAMPELEAGGGGERPASEGPALAEAAAFSAPRPSRVPEPDGAAVRDGVLVFTRESCPNCAPVASFVKGSGLRAVFVDVDQAEGLELARSFGILATPTVLALDAEGRESFRAFGVRELRDLLSLDGRAPSGAAAG